LQNPNVGNSQEIVVVGEEKGVLAAGIFQLLVVG
jgi:hypothetical protein